MERLSFYVSEETAVKIRREAKARGVSVSRYLASLIVKEEKKRGWPEGYFERIAGRWAGEDLVRPEQGGFEERDSL